jgi:glycosyltransferase involved in cell wall biosynthesis
MVSILVPVYNAYEYLQGCIDSLIQQTFNDLQIVSIDDGSTDNSWKLMQKFAAFDNRIEIYRQKNFGVALTRNRLLSLAKGDFILFVDSDDWIEQNTVELLMNTQYKGNYDIVSLQMVGAYNKTEGFYSQKELISLFLEHRVFNGSLCNKLIKKSLYENLRFDETVSYGEDALMIWQVLQRVDKAAIIIDELYHVGINRNSLSRRHFDDKKFSVFHVWESICKSVDEIWPQYLSLAHARFTCEMTLILRDAVKSNYKDIEHIKPLQRVIRNNLHFLIREGISTMPMVLFAWIVSHNYFLATCLARFIW